MKLHKNKRMKNKEQDGVMNPSADRAPRQLETWSDTNLSGNFDDKKSGFIQLQCRNCKGTEFTVLSTDSYETSARCCKCGMYYIVHCG